MVGVGDGGSGSAGGSQRLGEDGRRLAWLGPEGAPVLAHILGPAPDSLYAVSKTQVVVGRESTHNQADICVKENSYVSRGHIVLDFDQDTRRWSLSCNGKNGVFLNTDIVKKGASPVPIQERSTLRFPSTSVSLEFVPVGEGKEGSPVPSPGSTLSSASPLPKALHLDLASSSSPPFHPPAHHNSSTPSSADGGDGLLDSEEGSEASAGDADGKPAYSYAQLIVQAISSNPQRQLTLSGIYAFITKNYPYYRTCDKGWQNSIRHNLSLNRYFIKIPRNQEEPGKGKIGSYWRLDPVSEAKLLGFAWKKRRQRGGGPRSVGDSASSTPLHSPSIPAPDLLQPPLSSPDKMTRSAPVSPNEKPEPPTPPPSASSSALLKPEPHVNGVKENGKLAPPRKESKTPTGDLQAKRRPGMGPSPVEQLAAVALQDRSFFSLSAPCSPKAFGSGAHYPNGIPRDCLTNRSHHHSGGTFCVTRNVADGRQRLQLCHSPPEFVSVTRAESSALQVLAERSRRGTKSLSTTPIRELLASGGPIHLDAIAPSVAKALAQTSAEPKVVKKRKSSPVEAGEGSGLGLGRGMGSGSGVFRPVPRSLGSPGLGLQMLSSGLGLGALSGLYSPAGASPVFSPVVPTTLALPSLPPPHKIPRPQ